VIEVGVATPHHACVHRSGSSREFVASEASFGLVAVVECDGEAGAFAALQESRNRRSTG
jgi:hypothetical protein